MDKKRIILVTLGCCLLLVAAIVFATRAQNLTSIPDLKGELTWVKCSDPDCGSSYEMSLRDYYVLLEKKQSQVRSMGAPALICKKCGKESLFQAVKCEKCQNISFYGFGGPTDYADRCSKCGFSKLEEAAKIGSPQ
jgi:hypothetical protein